MEAKDIIGLISNAILGVAGVFVSFLILKVYKRQTKIFEKQLENINEQVNLQTLQTELNKKQLDLQNIGINYTEKQLLLQKQEFLPRFKIVTELKKIDNNEVYDTEFLRIINDGYFVNNFECNINTFFRFDKFDKNILKSKSILIPVNGYFAYSSGSGNKSNQNGELLVKYEINNNLIFTNLYREVIKASNDDANYSLYNITLVKIKYINFEAVSEEKYFEVFNGNIEISENDYNKYFKQKLLDIEVEYSSLTFNQLINYLDNSTI